MGQEEEVSAPGVDDLADTVQGQDGVVGYGSRSVFVVLIVPENKCRALFEKDEFLWDMAANWFTS